MHPILVRIPLPHGPLKLWWALTAVAVVSFLYAGWAQKEKDRAGAITGLGVALAAGVGAYAGRAVTFESPNLPLYSYGVMLGLSLVVGWYLTLTLAERDGLPKETMANCYVVTAVAAIVGSRLLYVVTNLGEFSSIADVFKVRLGGLVAYGGFLGGFLGSWMYLSGQRIRLMPWADVAVPSLASGLMITRIGCYLFGCDFGTRLSENAPGWLKSIGTFPHWAPGTVDSGDGAPAYLRHMDQFHGTPLGSIVTKTNASLPVHPTQIYESLVGLALLALLLWQRRTQRFRGQIFFLFVFGYGYLRFLLEIIRDDVERGEYGPVMSEHVIIPGALLLMSLGFVFGISLGIKNMTARTVARVAALLPPIVAFVELKPPSFGQSVSTQLSTSQWIGLITALLVSFFYARFWVEAGKQPKVAMSKASLGPGASPELEKAEREREKKRKAKETDESDADAEENDAEPTDEETEKALTETKAESPKTKKKKRTGGGGESEGDEGEPSSEQGGGTSPAPEG